MGTDVRIFGTKAALRKVMALQNADYISEDMKNEHYKTGLLGYWEGVELIQIEQVWDRNKVGTPKMSDTTLFVMPVVEEKFLKVVNEGDTQVHQVTDKDTNRDMTEEFEIQTKMGCGVMINGCIGALVNI